MTRPGQAEEAQPNSTAPRKPVAEPRAPGSFEVGRRVVAVVAAAIIAGVLTYAVSGAVTPTFSSASELRVVVGGISGLGEDSLVASNDLTAQLVQLVPTNKVLQAPAATLGLSVSALRSAISVGSVAQQNLLQITAEGSSAAASQRRAEAVTKDFISFMASDSRSLTDNSSASLSKSVQALNQQLGHIAAELHHADGAQSAILQSQYDSTLTQSQALSAEIAQLDAAGIPVIQEVQSAALGAEVAPRPKLYAIVAALVAAFIAVQFFVVTNRGRRSRRT